MKILKIMITGLGVISVFATQLSCKKGPQELIAENNKNLSNKASVQVYQATVNATRNYIYVDGKQVTGTTLVSGSVFPVSSTGTGFAVDGGLRSFLVRDTLPAATQPPLSFSEMFGADNRYTVFLYDTVNSPKQKTVQTVITIPTDTVARIRFANFVYSPVAVPNVDIYSKRKGVNIFTNVAVTDVTPFVEITSFVADTFLIRPTGTTTNLQNFTTQTAAPGYVLSDVSAILTPTRFRSYTLVFRGGYRTALTSAGTVRTLSIFAH